MKKRFLVLTCLVGLLGCGDESPSGGGRDGGARDGGRDGSTQSTCPEALACVDACEDSPCVDDCLDAASPAAYAQITDLAACAEQWACGDDDACIEERCGAEVALCFAVAVTDGGVDASDDATSEDPFPSVIEGTSRDFSPIPVGVTLESNATLRFVRDDVAGSSLGFPTSEVAFYRLAQIEYVATATSSGLACTTTAHETEAFTNPDAFENNLLIERTPNENGLYPYTLSTTLSVNHPTGLTVICPPPAGTTLGEFNAEHNISHGLDTHLTDGETFMSSTTIGFRQLSWNLHAAD